MKLELIGITKRFGSLVANDHIDLVVEPGQVHSLLGENGAGKSTLMNVLYGLYDPTEGEILVNDKPVTFKGPGDAMAAGIGMVHQHFMLVPVFTVAENVALGNEATKAGGMLDLQETRTRIRRISDQYGFDVDPDAVVEDLPVGVRRVEIIKALVRDAEVLILDEPTAVLTPKETDELLGIMAPEGRRQVHRLHLPQAPRGQGRLRRHHRRAARQGGRHRGPERPDHGAGLPHGRPVREPHPRQEAGHTR